MKTVLLTLLSVILLSGCASTLELKPTGSCVYQASSEQTYDYIRGRAHKCWRQSGGHFAQGIHVVKAEINGMPAIVVSRTSMSGPYDHRLHKDAVAELVFQPLGENRTRVEISEGGYLGGATLGLNADVARWVSGDSSCSE
jgi:hypothetical protein